MTGLAWRISAASHYTARDMQLTGRVFASYALGALRKGFQKLREQAQAPQLVAAARARMLDSDQIAGKRVLITGSTRGIGRALADGFACAGASVAIHGRREADALAAATAIREAGAPAGMIVGIGADLAVAGAGRTLVEHTLQVLGGLDLVINNAAIHDPKRKAIWTTTTEEMLELLHVNLVAAFDTSVAAITSMLERGVAGRIINISTGAADPAYITDNGIASYGISKAALEGLSHYLAAESKESTITTLRPGTLATDMIVPLFTLDERWGLLPPESLVPAALYLATAPRSEVHGRVFEQMELVEQLAKARASRKSWPTID
jgi:NAD(P)-dependent dehydrogenase (short-subunit alcohol dehydrogenase family)